MNEQMRRRSRSGLRMQRFLAAEDGTALVEFVIMIPLLIWAWLAMYYFWDVYSAKNRVQKAAFTVSDALTRSSGVVDDATIIGLNSYLEYLARGSASPKTRVTSIGWDTDGDRYFVMWSYSPDGKIPALTSATIAEIEGRLPELSPMQTLLVVETRVDYEPPMTLEKIGPLHIGMTAWTFSETVVSPPRFVIKVCFTGKDCSVTS